MKIERKLNRKIKSTDLFKEDTGKIYEIKTDHKTFLIVQETLKNAGNTEKEKEEANNKALEMLVGKENLAEIKSAIEKLPNYAENFTIAQIEIFSIAYGISFEEMSERFQKSSNKQK